ncbi:MAG TPA: class A beta-lactamase-related serine hydrolase, partial [Leucothrix mucor]|nr:class A beta-lactamase-related serine hydrolase [Leucothrix mucor]
MFTSKRSINNVLAHSIVFSFILFITACQSSSNTREKTIKDIRQSVKTTLKNDRAPGMAVALVNKDKIVFSEGFGVTTIGTQQMVSADTSFWLASISKTAIAVSIMHAREKGLLSLDADVYDL